MNQETKPIQVALVDDHILLRNALGLLVDNFERFRVMNQFGNGRELLDSIAQGCIPDIVILDLNMPKLNGYDTAEWLFKNEPSISVLMLTMYDSELSLIRLLQSGVKGFLKKDVHPSELRLALQTVIQTGFYYSNHTTGKLVNLFRNGGSGLANLQKNLLSDQEIEFLRLACSDMTYKEVAIRMGMNPRSIDTLRDQLFIKLDVRSRVGLAIVAIKNGVVTL